MTNRAVGQSWRKKSSVTQWGQKDLLKQTSYVLLWSQRPRHRVVDVCRQRQESQGVIRTAGKLFMQRERGARLCYANIGGERGTKKRKADTRKWLARFSMVRTARKIPSVTFLTTSFSGVYFVFYLYLCTATSALDYSIVLSINTALDTRKVYF